MVRLLLLFLTLFLLQKTYSQEEEATLFSEALSLHLPKYEIKAKNAYRHRDYEGAQILFDSLVKYSLNGSYMDNFKFNQLNKKEVALYEFKKPLYLITYASWCITTKGEIPALNQIAQKYSDRVDFVILFWDRQKTAKKAAKSYNKHITVLYIDELENKDAFVVSRLKHSLGLPTTFLMDENKQILDIRRGISHTYNKGLEESIEVNYNSFYDGIANHLLGEISVKSKLEPVALN